ncbi:MFS transporter [Glaciecola sp. MH2013]|uniref:MFS transporter n=1 Tax=Glaciecola sp. MH2013 TaxID=2785524 RepID=UPI00189E3502|nr:MFS transporter [Glaciecola sp. MH2013]MBF7073682.1 MFS transporter [Glaciecola sp. MH2013]
MNSNETRAAITLALVYVLRMLGLFMVIPVLAIAAVEYPDYSPLLVGLAIGGYGLTQAILQIPMGVLSDKWGRKPVIYLGLSFFIIGSVVAATADSMLMLTLGRVLQGAGAIAGAVMALASDVTRESQRAKVMAIIGVSIGFSFYLALLLGPAIAGSYGVQGIFWITAILTLCCLPLIHFGVKAPGRLEPAGDTLPQLSQLKSLFSHSSLWRLNISVLVVHLLITCFFVQVPGLLIAQEFQLGEHWKIYTPILIISVFILVLLMRVGKHLPTSVSFLLSLGLMALAFALFLLPTLNWQIICVAGILFFAGFNYMEAHMPAMVSSIAPAGRKGSAMGIYASHQFFGAFAGGLLSGLLLQQFGQQQSLIACIAIVAVCMLIVLGLSDQQKVKRLSLKLPSSFIGSTLMTKQVSKRLLELNGLLELVYEAKDNAFYLKVDSKGFELHLAKQVIADYAKKM